MNLRKSIWVTGVLIALALVWSPAPAFAQASPNDPTSGELVETPREFDGTTVTFRGEAIGEVMVRGDHAWIHLNDDAYMLRNVEEGAELGGYNSGMPVWVPTDEAEKIAVLGDYKHQGDVAEVVGIFNAACAEHGGDMDIHADRLSVIATGRRAIDPIHPWKIWLALALSVTATGLWYADRRVGGLERRGIEPGRGKRR